MQILILLLLIVIFFRPINRLVKGNHDLVDDQFAFLRWLLILFGIFIVFFMFYSFGQFAITGNKKHLTPTFIMFGLGLFYGVLLFIMRQAYQVRYREDSKSFTFKSIFRQATIPFDDIKQVNYYRSHRGGSGIRIKTQEGKKYRLPIGFFNMFKLMKYLQLNLKENFYQRPHRWLDLWGKRKPIPHDPFPEATKLLIKLESRLGSSNHIFFPSRKTKQGHGILQKPSKASLVLSILLMIISSVLLILLGYQYYRLMTGERPFEWDIVIVTVITIILGFIAIVQLQTYKHAYYFEDNQSFEVKYPNYVEPAKMKFSEISHVEVKQYKLFIRMNYHERNQNFILETRRFKPEKLMQYLAKNFQLEEEYKNGAFTIKRKVIQMPNFDMESWKRW